MRSVLVMFGLGQSLPLRTAHSTAQNVMCSS